MKHFVIPLAAVILLGGWLRPAAGQDLAVVTKCKGTVQIKAKDKDEWHKAALGEMLSGGMLILTGDDGYAIIKFLDDKSFVKILPKSGLKIDAKPEGRTMAKELYLKIGAIFTEVNKVPDQKFQIETATSLATVKGTRFWMSMDDQGLTTIICQDGKIDLYNKKEQKSIIIEKKMTGFSSTTTFRGQKTRDKDMVSMIGEKEGKKEEAKTQVLKLKFRNQENAEKTVEVKFKDAEQ
jgi:hypothetical protein